MNFPIIIVYLLSEDDRHRIHEDFSKVKLPPEWSVFYTNDEVEAFTVITTTTEQLLIVGVSQRDLRFAIKMKEKNSKLKVAQFGLPKLVGPPMPPFDILVTVAHPVHNYVKSLETVVSEFSPKRHRQR